MDVKLKAWLVNSLRRASYRWPPRYTKFNKARVERGKYQCAQCKGVFKRKEVALDHIEPVVTRDGFKDWNTYIERMFCGEEGYQVLCRDLCHKEKTAKENGERKLERQRKKLENKK